MKEGDPLLTDCDFCDYAESLLSKLSEIAFLTTAADSAKTKMGTGYLCAFQLLFPLEDSKI